MKKRINRDSSASNVNNAISEKERNLKSRNWVNNFDSNLQPPQKMTQDDISVGIKEESRQIKCESSPPTPRSLRLERVAQALAQSNEDLQQRCVLIQPPFVR